MFLFIRQEYRKQIGDDMSNQRRFSRKIRRGLQTKKGRGQSRLDRAKGRFRKKGKFNDKGPNKTSRYVRKTG